MWNLRPCQSHPGYCFGFFGAFTWSTWTGAAGRGGAGKRDLATLQARTDRSPVRLDYWIGPGHTFRLGSSLGDYFGCLSACALPAGLPDGADTAPGVQGCGAA